MQSTSLPTLVPLPFAANAGAGYKNVIPEASQIGIVNGAASLNDGFPPLTFVDTTAGGIAPFGQDFNGVLNLITQSIRAYNAGQGMTFNNTFANDSNVGGYPKGARLLSSDGQGYWRSTIDNNTNDPEAVNTGWVPDTAWGYTTVSMSNANVTLTFLQAAKYNIVITGTLSANLNLVFPTWQGVEWLIVNNASGAFSVTAKTAAGTGVAISTSANATVYCDGTNIVSATASVAQSSTKGARSNLKIAYTGTSGAVTVTANELVLENASNQYITLRNLNLTATTGSASGTANSLDTGSWAFSTQYFTHVIYNPTTTTAALLFSLSATAPTLPTGYTFSCRVGGNFTQSATNFWLLGGTQADRKFQYRAASGTNVTVMPLVFSGVAGTPGSVLTSSTVSGVVVPSTATAITLLMNCSGSGISQISPNTNAALPGGSSVMVNNSSATGAQIQAIFNLETSQVYYASALSNTQVSCLGWEDNL